MVTLSNNHLSYQMKAKIFHSQTRNVCWFDVFQKTLVQYYVSVSIKAAVQVHYGIIHLNNVRVRKSHSFF